MNKLTIFLSRLSKIGIPIHCTLNYPWVYINTINGKIVEEKYGSDYGWVLGFFTKKDDFYFEHFKDVFKLIRKYK